MSVDPDALRADAEELERAAASLRSPTVDPDEAAALVERCGELAARISAALEEQARRVHAEGSVDDDAPEQERLL